MLIRFWNSFFQRGSKMYVTATLFRLRKVESCLSLENVWMADVYDSCWIWQQHLFMQTLHSLLFIPQTKVSMWDSEGFDLSCGGLSSRIKNIGCLPYSFCCFSKLLIGFVILGQNGRHTEQSDRECGTACWDWNAIPARKKCAVAPLPNKPSSSSCMLAYIQKCIKAVQPILSNSVYLPIYYPAHHKLNFIYFSLILEPFPQPMQQYWQPKPILDYSMAVRGKLAFLSTLK